MIGAWTTKNSKEAQCNLYNLLFTSSPDEGVSSDFFFFFAYVDSPVHRKFAQLVRMVAGFVLFAFILLVIFVFLCFLVFIGTNDSRTARMHSPLSAKLSSGSCSGEYVFLLLSSFLISSLRHPNKIQLLENAE